MHKFIGTTFTNPWKSEKRRNRNKKNVYVHPILYAYIKGLAIDEKKNLTNHRASGLKLYMAITLLARPWAVTVSTRATRTCNVQPRSRVGFGVGLNPGPQMELWWFMWCIKILANWGSCRLEPEHYKNCRKVITIKQALILVIEYHLNTLVAQHSSQLQADTWDPLDPWDQVSKAQGKPRYLSRGSLMMALQLDLLLFWSWPSQVSKVNLPHTTNIYKSMCKYCQSIGR